MPLLPSRKSGTPAYLKVDRLTDVLALIPVLALDEHAHRSEQGLMDELQGKPRSSSDWTTLAKEHPEFFRVAPTGEHTISLIARHVSPKDNNKRQPLSGDITSHLMETAIVLHERQVKLAERWTYLIPIWVALITGLFLLLSIWFKTNIE